MTDSKPLSLFKISPTAPRPLTAASDWPTFSPMATIFFETMNLWDYLHDPPKGDRFDAASDALAKNKLLAIITEQFIPIVLPEPTAALMWTALRTHCRGNEESQRVVLQADFQRFTFKPHLPLSTSVAKYRSLIICMSTSGIKPSAFAQCSRLVDALPDTYREFSRHFRFQLTTSTPEAFLDSLRIEATTNGHWTKPMKNHHSHATGGHNSYANKNVAITDACPLPRHQNHSKADCFLNGDLEKFNQRERRRTSGGSNGSNATSSTSSLLAAAADPMQPTVTWGCTVHHGIAPMSHDQLIPDSGSAINVLNKLSYFTDIPTTNPLTMDTLAHGKLHTTGSGRAKIMVHRQNGPPLLLSIENAHYAPNAQINVLSTISWSNVTHGSFKSDSDGGYLLDKDGTIIIHAPIKQGVPMVTITAPGISRPTTPEPSSVPPTPPGISRLPTSEPSKTTSEPSTTTTSSGTSRIDVDEPRLGSSRTISSELPLPSLPLPITTISDPTMAGYVSIISEPPDPTSTQSGQTTLTTPCIKSSSTGMAGPIEPDPGPSSSIPFQSTSAP